MDHDAILGEGLADCRTEFERLPGGDLAFGVVFPDVDAGFERRVWVRVSGEDGRVLAWRYRTRVEDGADAPADVDWRSPTIEQDNENVWGVVSALGLSGEDRVAEGIPIGDAAVVVGQRLAALHPHLAALERPVVVAAVQRRFLAEGLAAVAAALGPARPFLYGTAMRLDPLRAENVVRIFSLPGAHANRLSAALRAYPNLEHLLLRSWRLEPPAGGPREAALAGLVGGRIPATHAAAILDRAPASIAVRPSTAAALSALPVDWIPACEIEWRALSYLSGVVGLAANVTREPVGALLAHSKGRWRELALRLSAAAGVPLAVRGTLGLGDTYGVLQDAVKDLFDMLRHAEETLIAPLLAFRTGGTIAIGEPDRLARAMLFTGRGLPRILEESRRWHGGAAPRTPGWERGPQAWDPVLPAFAADGLAVVPLSSRHDLAAEGARGADADGLAGLSHCVASRWRDCFEGRARIVSVRRRADGARLATAQFAFRRDETDPGTVRPHETEARGLGNGEVPPDARAALDAYLGAIASGHLAFDPAPLVRDARRGRGASVADRCGYDWSDPALLAEAVAAWAPFMTRPLRGLGPADLLAALEAKAASPGR